MSLKDALGLRNLKLATAVAVGLSGAPESQAVEPGKLALHSSPSQVARFIRGYSGAGGDKHESVGLASRFKGKWYSVAENGSFRNIFPTDRQKPFDRLMAELNKVKQGDDQISDTVWYFHNHSAELIYELAGHADGFSGVKQAEIVDRNKLLSGPTALSADCFRNKKGPTKDLKHISVVVEPGGMWICSATPDEHDKMFMMRNKAGLDKLREQLIVDSQKLSGIQLWNSIQRCITEFERLSRMRVEFLPLDASDAEMEEAALKVWNVQRQSLLPAPDIEAAQGRKE